MTGPGAVWPDDLAAVNVTDALLNDLAAGLTAGDHESADAALTELLASWRAELDDRAASVMTIAPPALPVTPAARPVRWARAHRRTAAAAALVVALAASTGVAAAESSQTGPLSGLHKLLWGDSPPAHHVDLLAIDAKKLLTSASHQINAAAQTGSIGASIRDQIASTLDRAEKLLQQDALAPQSLLNELHNLRTALAGIPDTAPPPSPPATVTDNHGHGHSGSDDNTSGDRHGGGGGDSQGDDNSSENTSNSNGSSSDDGNTQGSDDGSVSGGLQSGDGGGDTQSGDGGGDTQSGSGNDGAGSDSSDGSGGD